MKGFIVFSFFVAVCLAAKGPPPEFQQFAEECAKENNIELPKGPKSYEERPKGPPSHDHKCFMKCIVVKAGLFTEKGDLVMEKIKEKMSPTEEQMAVINKCSEENKQDDVCEKAFKMHKCIMKELKPKKE